ncbi:MAG: hypothetical protein ACK56I_11020, partial [bacterium]
ICIESIESPTLKYEVLNPWVGGNFNPFEGENGLDECNLKGFENNNENIMQSNNLVKSKVFCQCSCFPLENCKDKRNIINYTSNEFSSSDDLCTLQKFPSLYIM